MTPKINKMTQFIATYSINGRNANSVYTLAIDVKIQPSANESMAYILNALADVHSRIFGVLQPSDICLINLTKLN